MATIATTTPAKTITFITLSRQLPKPGLKVQDVTRPGVHGVGVKDVGIRGGVTRMVGTLDIKTANLAQLLIDLMSQEGQIATVTDDHGIPRTNVLIMRVAPREPQKSGLIVGGLVASSDYVVITDYDMIDTNVSA